MAGIIRKEQGMLEEGGMNKMFVSRIIRANLTFLRENIIFF